ncbi:MAG: CdaR family protein [Clostridia bacterium]|nr:CdaR family protein [Clostridia bacterium]
MKAPAVKKLFYNNKALALISLILSFLFWFLVVSNIAPDYTKTISGVKIQFSSDKTGLGYAGLHVIDTSRNTVSVVVSGPRYLIGQLSASDITVTPRLGAVNTQGTFNVALDAALVTANSMITIQKVDPATVSAYFDRITAKTLPITINVENTNVASGYVMQTATASPASVSVSGPSAEIAKLTKAVVTIKVNNNASDFVESEEKVILYDGSTEADLSHLQLGISTVDVTVPILKVKQLSLKVSYTNVPKGFDIRNVVCTISPANIRVGGKSDVIDSLSGEVNLGNLSIPSLGLTNTINYNIVLPSGISAVEGVTTATATITLKDTAMKYFNTRTISVVNVPSGYKVTVRTAQLNHIKLFGPAKGMGTVNAVQAVADMQGSINGTGDYEVPVTILVPGKSGYWASGIYNVLVEVTTQ